MYVRRKPAEASRDVSCRSRGKQLLSPSSSSWAWGRPRRPASSKPDPDWGPCEFRSVTLWLWLGLGLGLGFGLGWITHHLWVVPQEQRGHQALLYFGQYALARAPWPDDAEYREGNGLRFEGAPIAPLCQLFSCVYKVAPSPLMGSNPSEESQKPPLKRAPS